MPDTADNKKQTATGKPADNVIRLSFLERPMASGRVAEKFNFYDHLTFRNIVIGVGVLTVLVFLGSAVSVRLAFLTAALAGLFALVVLEMTSRRTWEKELIGQMRRMTGDYERLVRDVARNRNDSASLRRQLADAAGTLARGFEAAPQGAVEQRMLHDIAEQLSRLGDFAGDAPEGGEEEAADLLPTFSPAAEGAAGESGQLSEAQVAQLVNTAVRQDRIDLFLQPVVGLPQRKVRFYEMFSRIRINAEFHLPAARYIEVAVKQDLMPVIDNLLLLRGLQIVRGTDEATHRAFFFNITSLTLHDPKFMGDLVEFIAQNRALAPRLVFELAQQDIAALEAEILPVLDGLSRIGCRFSMDRVRALAIDFARLEACHVRFVKIDAGLLMEEIRAPEGLQRLRRLKADFDRHGIDLIVEKIETERQLLELLDVDIDYGQGYLFGKPVPYEKIKS